MSLESYYLSWSGIGSTSEILESYYNASHVQKGEREREREIFYLASDKTRGHTRHQSHSVHRALQISDLDFSWLPTNPYQKFLPSEPASTCKFIVSWLDPSAVVYGINNSLRHRKDFLKRISSRHDQWTILSHWVYSSTGRLVNYQFAKGLLEYKVTDLQNNVLSPHIQHLSKFMVYDKLHPLLLKSDNEYR